MAAKQRPVKNQRKTSWVTILVGGFIGLSCFVGMCADNDAKKPKRHATPATPTPAQPKETESDRMAALQTAIINAPNINAALQLTKPFMTDEFDATSEGAVLFSLWAANQPAGSLAKEIRSLPSTKHGRVMKDPDSERGKKICARGEIIEISLADVAFAKLFEGGMTNRGNIVRFVAVGDTGELVAGSRARYCGVVIGRQSYSNSLGGTAHAVYTVGAFDLSRR